MRKIIFVWTCFALGTAASSASAQDRVRVTDDDETPARRAAVARVSDSEDEDGAARSPFEARLGFESVFEGDPELPAKTSTRKAGRTLLTAAQDPVDAPYVVKPDYEPVPDIAVTDPVTTPVCAPDCPEFWEHRSGVWGEFLFWKPRGADVVYASRVDGTLATSVPIGGRSIADFGYDPGFRVGAGYAIDKCSSLTANYTWFRATNDDQVSLPGGGGSFLSAETVHPNTINVAADSLAASAHYDFSLQAIDLNYRALLWYGDDFAVNYLAGIKYAHVDQQFHGNYSILGTTTVDTNVDFSGTGPRFGLEGERRMGQYGLMVYSKTAVNFLVGATSADFLQSNAFAGVQAKTSMHDARIVTVPELELGGGWQSCDGCWRITAGYYMAAWFNMLTTPGYLSSVRTTQNTFEDQIKTLTLDGLTIRAEVRW